MTRPGTNQARAVVLALTVALTVGACGSSSKDEAETTATPTTKPASAAVTTTAAKTATTRAAPPDPCTVVTKDDAEALAGTALQPGVKAGPADDVMCTYSGDPSGPTAQVEYYFGDGAKKFFDIEKTLDHEFETLTGIGDEAHLEEFNVFFRVGTRWHAIRLVRLDDFAPYREPLIALATHVAAKG